MSVTERLRAARRRGGTERGGAPSASSGGSVLLEVGGRQYAAGLMWLFPQSGGPRRSWTMRQAREARAGWYAERGRQTGFWIGAEFGAGGAAVQALAPVVADSVKAAGMGADPGTWQLVLECGGRYAIVRGNGEDILPGGDLIAQDRAAALEALQAEEGWDVVYAPPGLVPGAATLEVVRAQTPCVLVAVAFRRAAVERRVGQGVVVVGVLGVLAFGAERGLKLYEDLTREVVKRTSVREVEEIIKDGVDAVGFLERCEATMARAPALPPMWERTHLECVAEPSGKVVEVTGRLPEGVLFSRWRLGGGMNGGLARRLGEDRLKEWDVGAVVVAKAWGGMGVAVSKRTWDGEQPSTVAFREAVDAALGTFGKLRYRSTAEGFSVTLRTLFPPWAVSERVMGIEWIEAWSVKQEHQQWAFVFARVDPRTVTRTIIEEVES